MKKALLLSFGALFAVTSFAQVEHATVSTNDGSTALNPGYVPFSNAQLKTTALGDTLYYGTQAQFAAGTNYYYNYDGPVDSGMVYGSNASNWKGFARLYAFSSSSSTDTGFNVIGVLSSFRGKVSASNTNTVTFSAWSKSTSKVNYKTKYFLYGMPSGAPIATTAAVPVKNLSLTNRTAAYFPTAIINNKADIYVGYTASYTWGSMGNDTFGVQRIADATQAGTNYYTVESSSKDTLLVPNVIIQESNGTWKSLRYQINISNGGDPIIYPIIRINCPTCFPSGIDAGEGLSLTGMYPNPATDYTNVNFKLNASADVEIAIMDAAGRMVKTIKENNMAAGAQTIKVETSGLAAGNYIMALETSVGGAIAVQFTIVK